MEDLDDLVYGLFIDGLIGYGAFAKKDIKKATFIGEYTGEIVPR